MILLSDSFVNSAHISRSLAHVQTLSPWRRGLYSRKQTQEVITIRRVPPLLSKVCHTTLLTSSYSATCTSRKKLLWYGAKGCISSIYAVKFQIAGETFVSLTQPLVAYFICWFLQTFAESQFTFPLISSTDLSAQPLSLLQLLVF